jgi:flagellar basal body-associated protein FliL
LPEVKKAKLDKWGDIPDIEPEIPEVQISSDYEVEPRVEIGRKWAFNKLLIIAAPILLVFLLVIGVVTYFITNNISHVSQSPAAVKKTELNPNAHMAQQAVNEKTVTKPIPGTPGAAAPEPEPLKIVYMKNFMIDLQDTNGASHVLMCDVAFDVVSAQKQDQLENNANVRSVIYRVAKSRSAVALRSVEERKKMKQEFAMELEKMLGEGSVKNVYFMNYFIM